MRNGWKECERVEYDEKRDEGRGMGIEGGKHSREHYYMS